MWTWDLLAFWMLLGLIGILIGLHFDVLWLCMHLMVFAAGWFWSRSLNELGDGSLRIFPCDRCRKNIDESSNDIQKPLQTEQQIIKKQYQTRRPRPLPPIVSFSMPSTPRKKTVPHILKRRRYYASALVFLEEERWSSATSQDTNIPWNCSRMSSESRIEGRFSSFLLGSNAWICVLLTSPNKPEVFHLHPIFIDSPPCVLGWVKAMQSRNPTQAFYSQRSLH